MAGLLLFLTMLATVAPIHASNHASLGYSEETTIVGPERECSGGTLVYNHDGSFESAYAWQYNAEVPPYYGAFGEGYGFGAGLVACGAFWLTTGPGWPWHTLGDCYVWAGGNSSRPGAVLGVVTGVTFHSVPSWPYVAQNDVGLSITVHGEFTVGYWGVWPNGQAEYYCAADLDGPPGHPWTCIAPGIGYPSGWQDPSIVWGPTSAMGCGVYFESDPTPAESETWGAVKAVFR